MFANKTVTVQKTKILLYIWKDAYKLCCWQLDLICNYYEEIDSFIYSLIVRN